MNEHKEKVDLTPIMLRFLEKIVKDYLSSDEENDVEELLFLLEEFNPKVIEFFHAKVLLTHLGRQKQVTRAITGVSETKIWRIVDKK